MSLWVKISGWGWRAGGRVALVFGDLTLLEVLLLVGAGTIGGIVNSVSSGGSFFTYPAMLLIGLPPIEASATTLAALAPGNMAAIPEYVPEIRAKRHLYPPEMGIVFVGGMAGTLLLWWTGADAFEVLVPWLILAATVLFAVSPAVRRWAERSAPSLTDGWVGAVLLLLVAVYLTYFGSGSGNLVLALFTIRGFGDFLSANAAKNVAMALGATIAAVVYGLVGLVSWWAVLPVAAASASGARFGSKVARSIPVPALRAFVICFGLFVAAWQFAT